MPEHPDKLEMKPSLPPEIDRMACGAGGSTGMGDDDRLGVAGPRISGSGRRRFAAAQHRPVGIPSRRRCGRALPSMRAQVAVPPPRQPIPAPPGTLRRPASVRWVLRRRAQKRVQISAALGAAESP